MTALNKRQLLRRMRKVYGAVQGGVHANARDGGKFGRGLASEGWEGGYLAALRDVEAMLTHGFPSGRFAALWRAEDKSDGE